MHVEVRAGEGGEDAVAFAADLAAAILAHARRHARPASRVEQPASRTIVLAIDGELPSVQAIAGVHRVQRVPAGDRHGRRHTSTATVAVLAAPAPTAGGPVPRADLTVDFFRGTGPGGQHRNKTETAVRVRHRHHGWVVTRTSGRSQADNLASALAEMDQRWTAHRQAQAVMEANRSRQQQIAPERSAKAFTHNVQRGVVHRHTDGASWPQRAFGQGRWA